MYRYFYGIFCSIYFVPYTLNGVSFKPVGTVQNIFSHFTHFAIFTKTERAQAIPQSLAAVRAARTRRVTF